MIAAFTLNVSIDRRYEVAENRNYAVNRVQSCTYSAGGKGLNVARVLHALGEPVLAGGIVGGYSGRYIMRRLDEEGIAHQFTQAAGESRSCINILDLATGKQTEYLEPGMCVNEEEYASFLKDFDSILEKCRVLTISGSLPKGLSSQTYADLIKRASQSGCRVLLDASGAALANAIGSNPYYIKPNEDEIKGLVGCDASSEDEIAQAALQLHKNGISYVVVSMGSRGALAACDEGIIRGVPPHIQAVNTVGCGDSMTAAFAAAAAHDMSPKDAMKFAIGVSAASALSPDTGGLDKEVFEQLLPQVQVYSL